MQDTNPSLILHITIFGPLFVSNHYDPSVVYNSTLTAASENKDIFNSFIKKLPLTFKKAVFAAALLRYP